MQLLTVDSVVRSALVTTQKPIHYYVRYLHFALKCIEELKLGVLKTTKTVRLTVDAYNEIDIPSDYIDWVRIGYERGKYVIPLGEKDSINSLPKLDANGNQTTYGDIFQIMPQYQSTWFGYYPAYEYNDYREFLGKRFGYNDSGRGDTFKIIPERSKIHVGSAFQEDDVIVMEYVYFSTTSTQSLISKYAAETIESYIIYKFLRFKPGVPRADIMLAKKDYDDNFRKLMARMNPITKEMIVRLKRKNTKLSIKS